MKKLFKIGALSLFLCTLFISGVSAISWSASESLEVPSWGAMSKPTNATKTKTKACTYGYIEKTADSSTFAKYGDFYRNGRISKTYYQIYLNNLTKIYYNSSNTKSGIPVKARICGSDYEPSAGTRISIKFSADN